MTCSRVHPWLHLYLDGRLDARRQPALARHLQTCAACRRDLATYQLIAEGAGAPDPVAHPEELTRVIMARIRQADARLRIPALSPAFALGWADALLAAGLATIMTLAFLFFEPTLRFALSGALAFDAATLARDAAARAAAWPTLAVWLVWVGIGIVLTLWFAGREVRATWRRAVVGRLTR